MAIVDELVTILRFKAETADMDKFQAQFKEVKDLIEEGSEKLGEFLGALGGLTSAVLESVDDQARFAKSIGITFTELQKLEYAAESVGGAAGEMRGDLKTLAKLMKDTPGEFSDTVLKLGLHLHDLKGNLVPAGTLLDEISEKLQGMSTQRQLYWVEQLGLSDTTLELLKEGKKGIAELKEEAAHLGALVPEDDLKSVREYRKTWKELSLIISGVVRTAVVAISPVLKDLLLEFRKWIKENNELIKVRLKEFIIGATEGLKRFVAVLSGCWTVVKKTGDFLRALGVEIDGVGFWADATAVILTAGLISAMGGVVAKAVTVISGLKTLVMFILSALVPALKLCVVAWDYLTVSMMANPIGLIVSGIVALIAAFLIFVSKAGGFTKAFYLIGQAVVKTLLLPLNLSVLALTKLMKLMSHIPGFKGLAKFADDMERARAAAYKGTTASDSANPFKEVGGTFAQTREENKAGWAQAERDRSAELLDKWEAERAAKAIKRAYQGDLSDPDKKKLFGPNPVRPESEKKYGHPAAALFPGIPREASRVSNNTSSASQTTNLNQTININGARDARAIGDEVRRRTSDSMKLQQMQPGVRAPAVG